MNPFNAPRYYYNQLVEKQERRAILNARLSPHARPTDTENIRVGFTDSILEHLTIEIAELDTEIEQLNSQYLDAREKLKEILSHSNNHRAKLVIELHDLDLMEWPEISKKIYVSIRQLRRLQAQEAEALGYPLL